MPKQKNKQAQSDSIYILKLVIYLILGSLWVRINTQTTIIPLPLGFLIGLLVARTERFSLERRIDYAFLVMAMFVGFWLPIGIEILL